MHARIAQLLARYLGVALAAVATAIAGTELSAEQAGQVADLSLAIGTALGAALAFVADLLIHRLQRGGVLTDDRSKAVAPPPTKSLRCHLWLAVLAAIPVLVLMGGCCESTQRGYLRADAIGGVLEPVLDRHDAWVSEHAESPIEAETWLRSSRLLRETVDEAQAGGSGHAPEPG